MTKRTFQINSQNIHLACEAATDHVVTAHGCTSNTDRSVVNKPSFSSMFYMDNTEQQGPAIGNGPESWSNGTVDFGQGGPTEKSGPQF